MAITAAERTQIIKWLRYPAGQRFTAAIYAIDSAIARLEPTEEDEVRLTLQRLEQLDTSIYGDGTSAGGAVQQAGIKQLGQGEIEWFPSGAWSQRATAQQALMRRLSDLLGVVVLGGMPGGGGPIPLG